MGLAATVRPLHVEDARDQESKRCIEKIGGASGEALHGKRTCTHPAYKCTGTGICK